MVGWLPAALVLPSGFHHIKDPKLLWWESGVKKLPNDFHRKGRKAGEEKSRTQRFPEWGLDPNQVPENLGPLSPQLNPLAVAAVMELGVFSADFCAGEGLDSVISKASADGAQEAEGYKLFEVQVIKAHLEKKN